MGAHQKIDRLARSNLTTLLKRKDAVFPSIRQILHFEGVNGPDAIKRKSPARDEPWHYYMPFDENDTALLGLIEGHYDELATALKNKDTVRAAFESAWLAHAIVDGLTPAHHYPYEAKLAELRGGAGRETRDTIRGKILMPGDTRRQQMRNNWVMWGPGGLLMSHGFFEFGVAFIIKPLTARRIPLRPEDIAELREYGLLELFKRKAREVDTLGLYTSYQKYGWTPRLAWRVRTQLMPAIVHTVALAWYAAAIDAGITKI